MLKNISPRIELLETPAKLFSADWKGYLFVRIIGTEKLSVIQISYIIINDNEYLETPVSCFRISTTN